MVRQKDAQNTEFRNIRGGIGDAFMEHILNNAEEMHGHGPMFCRMTIAPGNTIGEHTHTGNFEVFYVLSGSALYNDNGTPVRLCPGDTAVCSDGEMHGLVNDTDDDFEMIAMILNA